MCISNGWTKCATALLDANSTLVNSKTRLHVGYEQSEANRLSEIGVGSYWSRIHLKCLKIENIEQHFYKFYPLLVSFYCGIKIPDLCTFLSRCLLVEPG